MAIETRYPPGGLRDLNADILWQSGIHPSKTGLSGSRVVCCIIDYGFDLLHPALREADGSTRFAALIDQNGAIHDRAAINALIKLSEEAGARGPADALYDPHANYFGRDGVTVGAHGTWVASIAAGTSSSGFTGVAPQATLIGVHLDLADDAWRAADLAEFSSAAEPNDGRAKRWRSYDQSQTIVEALQSALTAALALDPDGIVLNLSIGAWAGSHHASAAVNRAITRVSALNDLPGGPAVFVVAGTGNAGDDRGHFGATIAPGTTRSLTWHFGAGRPTAEKLEIWSDQPISVRFRTATQSNNDQASLVLDGPGLKQLFIDHRLAGVGERVAGPCDELTCAHFLIMPDRLVEGGVAGETIPCVLDITCEGTRAGEVHVWIERDCAGATSHLEPSNRASTLTSLASAPGVLAVAGLGECDTTAPSVMAMSGRGPAPWARCTEATASPFEAAPAKQLRR
jgi:hypothetical protein